MLSSNHRGRIQELTAFPLVELVIGMNENVILDITSRCDRKLEGIYVIVSALITNEEAKSLATSDGFGVRIRGSPSADMFLGIGVMATDGAQDKLISFVSNLS